jgi:iron complex outermembrane receptor protein
MRSSCILFVALPLALSTNVYSQASTERQSATALEEIIVTASKRATSLQDTAIAVTAFTADMQQELNINSPFDYEKLVPSLNFQESPNRVSIRGVGRFSNSLGVNPGVGIYNDGIYFPEATSLSTQPINIQRTEILRGPQGTLYGRNTTGGAVNVISRRPTEEFEGDFRVSLGNYDYQQYAFVVSGPVTDDFRYKLHYIDTQRDGLQENKAGDDIRETDNWYGEAQIEWDITDKLMLWVEYGRLQVDGNLGAGPSEDPYDCVNFWDTITRSAQFLDCARGVENASLGDVREVAHDTPGFVKTRNNNNWAAELRWDLEDYELSYLFGYIEYDYDSRNDSDGTANPNYQVFLDIGQYQKQTSHELQLTTNWDGPLNIIAGLYYFEDENEQPYNINTNFETFQNVTTSAQTPVWENPLGIIYFQEGRIDNDSWAIYSEGDYEFNDQWTLTLGARYSEDNYDGEEVQLIYYDAFREYGGIPAIPEAALSICLRPDLGFPPCAFDASQATFAGDPTRYVNSTDDTHEDEFDNLTWKAALSYRPREGHLFYGSVSTGYKMGGTRLGSLERFYSEEAGVPSDGKFAEEELTAYELGWKGELMDRRLLTEVIAFFYDYEDMQRNRNFETPAGITLDEVINVDAEIFGIEASATWLITDNLRGIFSYSYNDNEITSDTFFEDGVWGERDEEGNVIPENLDGRELTLTPEHKGSVTLHYFWPTDIGEFTIGGTWSYMGKRYFDLGNYDNEGSYDTVDAQASWTSTEGRYRIQANVTNLTDEDAYNTRSCDTVGSAVYGTDSYIIRCGGNPLNQRLWYVEFSLLL